MIIDKRIRIITMKKIYAILTTFTLSIGLWAQTPGDFRTIGSGSWSNGALWEYYVHSSVGWTSAYHIYPDGTSHSNNTITINHNITLSDLQLISHAIIVVSPGITLTINGTGKLELSPDGNLVVNGTFNNNNGNSGFIIHSTLDGTGNLNYSGSATGTLETYLEANKWHLVGPPNDDLMATTFLTGWMQTWADGNPGSWTAQEGNPSLVRGRGAAYFLTYNFTADMAGTLNGAAKTIGSLTNAGGADDGWHLLANPFPCAIDLDLCSKDGGIGSTYLVYNGSSYVTPSLNIISPSQGFFIQVTSGTNSFNFPTSSKVNNNWGLYKSLENDLIQLKLSDNMGISKDELIVHFDEEATTEFDGEFDGHKLMGDPTAGEIMAQITEEEFACVLGIPFSEETTTVKVDFKKGDAHEYTLELAEILLNNLELTLEDTETGFVVDLAQSQVYNFTAENSSDSRFLLHFKNASATDELPKSNPIRIWSFDNFVYISQDFPDNGVVEIIDISGKLVFTTNIAATSLQKIEMNEPKGAYIVRLISGNQTFSQKIIK